MALGSPAKTKLGSERLFVFWTGMEDFTMHSATGTAVIFVSCEGKETIEGTELSPKERSLLHSTR